MTDRETNDLLFSQAKALLEKKAFQDKVYSDEPLLFTASRLLEEDDVPENYRELVKLSTDPRFGYSEAARFYEQAKLMENFEEDEDYTYRGRCNTVYPSYAKMKPDELRGYFSWRTKVRRGNIVRTEYPFVVVYISELINLIGVKDCDEGFEKLTAFLREYSALDSYILFQGLRWAKNFAIYYNIDPAKYAEFSASTAPESVLPSPEQPLCTLVDFDGHSNSEMLAAITALSSYNIFRSKWAKQFPDEVEELVCRIYRALNEKYEGTKTDLIRLLFPFMYVTRYQMTFNSLFHQPKIHPDCVYRLSPIEIYECRAGLWTRTGMDFVSPEIKSRDLGLLLKAIDYHARIYHAIVPNIAKPPVRETWNRLVETEMKKYFAQKDEEEKKRRLTQVKIDTSLLETIRSDSDITREKLMTSSELSDADFSAPEVQVQALPEEEKAPESRQTTVMGSSGYEEIVHTHQSLFSEEEIGFIRLVLTHGNIKSYAKANGTFVSAYADKINAITLDSDIADLVIECSGDTAEVIEDYIEELKELAGL